MKTSLEGTAEIAGHEGIVTSRYKDSVGVWSIGIGHTKSAGAPDPFSATGILPIQDVFDIFSQDLKRFEYRVNRLVKISLRQHEFDALVSFDFNTGGLGRSKLLKHLNRGDKVAAGNAFMGWKKPKEIISRRKAEQALFRTGRYSSGMATIYAASPSGAVQQRSGELVNVLKILRGSGRAPIQEPTQPDDPGVNKPAETHWLTAILNLIFKLVRRNQ